MFLDFTPNALSPFFFTLFLSASALCSSSAMASSSSSSSLSSYEDPAPENPKSIANRLSSNVLLLSSEFFRPFKPNLQATIVHPQTIGKHLLQFSVSSMVERCLKLVHCVASQNPFLKNVSSLSSHFRTFFQIPCRDFRSVNSISNHSFAAILPGDSVAGIVVSNGIMNFLNLYNTLLIVRLVLTWFPNSPPAIVSPLSTLCDPYLNIFRGLIPPLGGTLDLSPILAFLVLNAFTSTAAALPAELPATGDSRETLCHASFSGATTSSQRKWMRRLFGNRSK